MSKRGHRAEVIVPCRAASAFGWKEPRPQTQARWSHSPSRACFSPSPCCSWPCASSPNAPGKLQCCHDHACAGSRPHDLVDTRVPSGWRVQADLAPGASGCPNNLCMQLCTHSRPGYSCSVQPYLLHSTVSGFPGLVKHPAMAFAWAHACFMTQNSPHFKKRYFLNFI